MIVCSCNVFSDTEVRACAKSGPEAPRKPRDVYTRLGCTPKCGRCAETIRKILDETCVTSGDCAQPDHEEGCAMPAELKSAQVA
jgi:bacterioferritin-associated ferredoxin